MMRILTLRAAAVLAVAMVLSARTDARASVLTVPFGQEYTSGTAPAGPGPWLTAKFDDHGATGSVTLTITGALGAAGEFVTDVSFNLDPALDPSQLVFSGVTKFGTFADPQVSAGQDAFSAGGGSRFDLQVEFDNSPPVNRFDGTDSVSLTISGIPGLTAGSFGFNSVGGSGSLLASAHVQGTGSNNQNSAWLTVPEPGALSLLGLALPLLLKRRGRVAPRA